MSSISAMSHDHGSPEIHRKARSIARLFMVVVFIAAVPAIAVVLAWAWWW